MGKNIQYSGLALIIIGAIVLIASYFAGWNNINAVIDRGSGREIYKNILFGQ